MIEHVPAADTGPGLHPTTAAAIVTITAANATRFLLMTPRGKLRVRRPRRRRQRYAALACLS